MIKTVVRTAAFIAGVLSASIASAQQQIWWWCPSARAYYPQVQICPTGTWQQVAPMLPPQPTYGQTPLRQQEAKEATMAERPFWQSSLGSLASGDCKALEAVIFDRKRYGIVAPSMASDEAALQRCRLEPLRTPAVSTSTSRAATAQTPPASPGASAVDAQTAALADDHGAMYQKGLDDRATWEEWFNSLQGDYKTALSFGPASGHYQTPDRASR
jgi:hypothetical protein